MKFVCDRCQTKYSIADEKVRGKILKVRCKTCSNVVTVREPSTVMPGVAAKPSSPSLAPVRSAARPASASQGPSQPAAALARAVSATSSEMQERTAVASLPADFFTDAPPPPPPKRPTRAPVPAADDVEGIPWFMALDGQQQGPFTKKKLVDKLATLAPDADLHVWNEKMPSWKPPLDVPELARELAARRKPAPPPPPGRPAASRPTPPAPVASLAAAAPARGGHTQALGGPLGAAPVRLPRPSSAHPVLGVPAPGGASAGAADLDPSSLLETPGPAPAQAKTGRSFNGVTAHGLGGHASLPAMQMPPVESDAMNALNLRNGGRAAAGSAPRIMPAGAVVGWQAPGASEAAAGRHRNAKFIVGLLGIVGVVCVILLFNVMRRPTLAPPPTPSGQSESQFGTLAEKIAAEKPVPPPVVQPQPPPPPPAPDPKSKTGRKTHGPLHATAKTTPPPMTTPPPPAAGPALDPATLARFRETGGRTVKVASTGASEAKTQATQADILRVISNNRNGIKTCYQRALTRDSSLVKGKITVHIKIGMSGRVKGVDLNGSPQFRVIEPCVREVVSRWMFPAASDEYETEFVSTFQGGE